MSHTLWNSERLYFRGVNPDDDDFLASTSADPDAFLNAASLLPTPRNNATTLNLRQYLEADRFMVATVICITPPAGDDSAKPTPIGTMTLAREDARFHHHRHCDIGINILKKYQGQGYGSEAIRWAMQFAFRRAGMHRVGIGGFAYNTGALKLYERLGFKHEGVKREFLWHDGDWYDYVSMSMLDREWKEFYDTPKGAK